MLILLGKVVGSVLFFCWTNNLTNCGIVWLLFLGYECKKRITNSIFQDEEKSNILRKLLQSKDPEDIQAANWLIKSMVKEVF